VRRPYPPLPPFGSLPGMLPPKTQSPFSVLESVRIFCGSPVFFFVFPTAAYFFNQVDCSPSIHSFLNRFFFFLGPPPPRQPPPHLFKGYPFFPPKFGVSLLKAPSPFLLFSGSLVLFTIFPPSPRGPHKALPV